MALTLTNGDLLLCMHVRRRRLLSDPQLEAALCQWLSEPRRPLLDVIAVHARLSEQERADCEASLDGTSLDGRNDLGERVDPQNSRLRELPAGIRRLLTGFSSDVVLATEAAFETRPADSKPSGVGADVAVAQPSERFDVMQILAQGGLGVVYLARDHDIDRTVALKQIKSQWADDEDSRARFLLEARVTGRLEHPGIVPIYALGADASGRPYYAMRLIRGESLLDALDRFHDACDAAGRRSQRMPELRKLLRRFVDVCNAVDYAHSKGVIHRDIKPSNIMVGKFGETLVVDWGLAKVIGSDEDVALTTRMVRRPESEGGSSTTRVGTTIGTPAYMSPEQASGRNDELSPATDVYSLGATLYHLLTGYLPHVDDDDTAMMLARAEHGRVVPMARRAPWLPRPLVSICMKALASSPERRYVSARALSDDLERWLADEPVQAHAEGLSERAFRWMRNHRTLATSLFVGYLVATAAVAVGVVGWSYLRAQQAERRRAQPAASTGAESPTKKSSADSAGEPPLSANQQ